MTSKEGLRKRGRLRSVADIIADEPHTEWEKSRVARSQRRAKDPLVRGRADKHKQRLAEIALQVEDDVV